ncbi:MAG: hypothetical protein J6125_02350 [Clostridia bacterium]|nr:hypothetical protein [Clostridia bacterium]
MKKYKVLVTYMEAGMGHITSADAIADALETYYPDEVEVERSHVFTETGDPVLKKHEDKFVREVRYAQRHHRHMFFLTWLEYLLPPLWTLTLTYSIAYPRVKRRLQKLFRHKNPDVVLCTHWTPLHCAIEDKKRRRADYLTALYVPDPNVHGWWDHRADLTLLNNPRAYEDAMREGFDPKKTILSRFILRTAVKNATRDKAQLRAKHGLPLDAFTVAVADGVYAEANLKPFTDALIALGRPMTILIIAGKNETLYRHYSELAGTLTVPRLFVYRFVPDAHELYGAADLFVTKAGPNALLDCVCMGTPVLTNYYSSPIEQITNELYIDQCGVGTYTTDPAEGARRVAACMDDPSLLDPYREKCKAFVETHVGGEKEMADALIAALRAAKGP